MECKLPKTSSESWLPSIQNAQVLLYLQGLNVISRSGSGCHSCSWTPKVNLLPKAALLVADLASPPCFSSPATLSHYQRATVSAFKGDESIGATDRNTHRDLHTHPSRFPLFSDPPGSKPQMWAQDFYCENLPKDLTCPKPLRSS